MLRPLDPDRDGPALHAIFGGDESCRFLPDKAVQSVADTVSLLKKWNDGTEDTTWAIAEAADGGALGRVTMMPRGRDIWEVGIMLCPAAQGRGLAFKALCETLDITFVQHRARRIYADVDPDNTPSVRLFERLGFQREGVLRANWDTHIGIRDSIIFALVASDPRPWKS